MGKNRNSKKFRKKLNKKNQMRKQHSNHSPNNWFTKTIKKVFNQNDYKKLSQYLEINSEVMSSKDKLELKKVENELCKKLIDNVLKNKDIIRKLFKYCSKKNYGTFIDNFNRFVYTPFFIVGNKHMDDFEEYYDFISEFSLGNMDDEINEYGDLELEVFRVMEETEYLNLLMGNGVESPSFTQNPFYLQSLRGNNTLMDTSKKSVFVLLKFKGRDIISNYNLSKESEIIVRKGSIPTMMKKFNEYDINNVIDDLGEGVVDYLPLTPNELNNGFTYMDGLSEKGYDLSNEYKKTKGGMWMKYNFNKDRWVNSYYQSITNIVSEYCNKDSSPQFQKLKEQIKDLGKLGNKMVNNPFLQTT